MSEETKKAGTEAINVPVEEEVKEEKKKEREEWGSPEEELMVLENPEFRFKIQDRKFVLRPIKLKHLRGILADVFALISIFSNQQDLLKAVNEVQKGSLNPALILVVDSVFDSFSRILSKILEVEVGWLEEHLEIGHLGPIFFHFLEQNNIALLVENFQKAANQFQTNQTEMELD